METKTLHIIGNGFDLHHKIQSSYKDFKEFAWKNEQDNYYIGMLESCYPDIDKEANELVLWSDLEKALGNIDFEASFNICTQGIELEEEHKIRYQAAMEDAPSTFLPAMYDAFHAVFEDWVSSINIEKIPDENLKNFDKDGIFLQFNYTETLERLYNVPRQNIEYIHGRRNSAEPLIVGHCNDLDGLNAMSTDSLVYEYQAYEDIANIVNNEQKNVSEIIAAHNTFFNSLNNINKVVVYGHSLSEVDQPYFKKVADCIRENSEWYFSLYHRNEIEHKEALDKIRAMISYLNLNEDLCHTFNF